MDEFDLIRRFFVRDALPGVSEGCGPPRGHAGAILGPGDDCALLAATTTTAARFAVTTDLLVEGVHFFSDVDPQSLGHKALAVNLSDLAAMGARPVSYLLALALPRADIEWLEGFARGLHTLADVYGIELVGGDTTRGPLTIAITALGEVDPAAALRRDRARPGDDIWVSGCLGAAAFAVRERLRGHPLPASHPARMRLEEPVPRVELGLELAKLSEQGLVHAAIDLSDGLAGDLSHILARSGAAMGKSVGAVLWCEALPSHACLNGLSAEDRHDLMLSGGDDYELLWTAPSTARSSLERLGGLHRIGTLDTEPTLRLRDGSGGERVLPNRAYQHFRSDSDQL
jgi:thiamine-monophosphate kinase